MNYILFIHKNTVSSPTEKEWQEFFDKMIASQFFKGGSSIANSQILGQEVSFNATTHIGGFMRFETDNKSELLALLEDHPVVRHGGTIELCEMPKD